MRMSYQTDPALLFAAISNGRRIRSCTTPATYFSSMTMILIWESIALISNRFRDSPCVCLNQYDQAKWRRIWKQRFASVIIQTAWMYWIMRSVWRGCWVLADTPHEPNAPEGL